MSQRLPRIDKEALQELHAVVAPKLRVAARRVAKQLYLLVIAKLPTGARDDRPLKERLGSMWVVLKDEVAAQAARLRGDPGAWKRRWRNVARELGGRIRDLRR